MTQADLESPKPSLLAELIERWTSHASKEFDPIPTGWDIGHWRYSRLLTLINLLHRISSRERSYHQYYVERLDALERCCNRAYARGYPVTGFYEFLNSVDEWRSNPLPRLILVDTPYRMVVVSTLEKMYEDLEDLKTEVSKRGGLASETCRKGTLRVVKLGDAPEEFPEDLLHKIEAKLKIAECCYEECAKFMQPILPKDEASLISWLENADYNDRLEFEIASLGTKWPPYARLLPKRRGDLDFLFMDIEEIADGIEHFTSTDVAGLGAWFEGCGDHDDSPKIRVDLSCIHDPDDGPCIHTMFAECTPIDFTYNGYTPRMDFDINGNYLS